MTIARYRAPQTGAIYVEAAIILPVLLLVVFASIFFFLLAARHFSLQMLANEIAKDVSLALDPRTGVEPGIQGSCIQNTCTYTDPPFNTKLHLPTFLSQRYGTGTGCCSDCARRQYLLATAPSGSTTSGPWLQVSLTAHPTLQWFDPTPGGTTTIDSAAVGDFVQVELRYPAQAILGGGIAMFGATPDISIVGTAIAVLERPSR